MGWFGTESNSKTTTDASVTNVGASDNARSINVSSSGKKSSGSQIATEQAAILSATGSGIVNYSATYTSTTNEIDNSVETDNGALATASSILRDVIASQANLTMESAEGLRELALTKVSDGANLNQKTTIVALTVFALLGVCFLIFYRMRK
jgi:hypothetical protein